MDQIDPYRPDATVDERVDHVIGALLHDEDPVRRYRTVQALQDGRLRDVAAISLRQLRDQHGTTEAAAAAVGISRQAVNELLGKAAAGAGARQDRAARDQPAYAYGQYIAAVAHIASLLPEQQREHAIDQTFGLVEKASQTLALLPRLEETAARWLKTIRVHGRPPVAESWTRRLDAFGGPELAAWAADRGDLNLSIQEQSEVWLGYHHARARWRAERAEQDA